MLNILRGYIENSLPSTGILQTRPSLTAKVDKDGHFLPFIGNTAVFLLDEPTKQAIIPLQEALYAHAGSLLAERLSPDTFHLTLHDLANGPPGSETRLWMAKTAAAAPQVLNAIRAEDPAPLSMKATWVFNMVNTSIVLGAEPADADTHARLSRMYTQIHPVVPLNYALTPHITLAYFRPGCYTQTNLAPLRKALKAVDLTFSLQMENLVFQNFSDMNHYETV